MYRLDPRNVLCPSPTRIRSLITWRGEGIIDKTGKETSQITESGSRLCFEFQMKLGMVRAPKSGRTF